jgi:hypothetical protein
MPTVAGWRRLNRRLQQSLASVTQRGNADPDATAAELLSEKRERHQTGNQLIHKVPFQGLCSVYATRASGVNSDFTLSRTTRKGMRIPMTMIEGLIPIARRRRSLASGPMS